MMKTQKPYGTWPSLISPTMMSKGMAFSDVQYDTSGALVWREWRGDRGVIVLKYPDSPAIKDLNDELNVRGGVGYGGGDFTVRNGVVVFAEATSGRFYKQSIFGGPAKSITPGYGNFASPAISPNGKYVLFVQSYEGKDVLGIVDIEGKCWPQILVSGDDFYMQPVWTEDGTKIAWVSWNHPNMPWDGTEIYIAEVKSGEVALPGLGEKTLIAGGDEVSVINPTFSPDNVHLAYISDETGWWQVYLHSLLTGEVKQITKENVEHGVPAWIQGVRLLNFDNTGQSLYYLMNNKGIWTIWRWNLRSETHEQIALAEEYTWIAQPSISPTDNEIALLASGGKVPTRVIAHTQEGQTSVIRYAWSETVPRENLSEPELVSWIGEDRGEVFGLLYPPTSTKYSSQGLPPLLVLVHGGPTAQRYASFDPQAQYFATRGYAVLQVNYRGSTGYGRDYRDALKGNWGIYDVEDSVSGAQHLVNVGKVDKDRLIIAGGSAGGFTVLKALEDYPGFFKAGVNMYGVSNQFTLASDTHKFEERYSESLLGVLPETTELYRERSPIFFADRIKDAMAVFQGEDDKVVPRVQSDEIVAALQKHGIPHEYHVYPGEGHGFRKEETIKKFYTSFEKFLTQYVIYS